MKARTSTSAFLTIGIGPSGFFPGARGIPRNASTVFLGGGSKQQVMNLRAFMSVCVAMCLRRARQTAVISAGVRGSRGCHAAVVWEDMVGGAEKKIGVNVVRLLAVKD